MLNLSETAYKYESFLSIDPDSQNQWIQLPSYNRKLMMVAVEMRKEILFYWIYVGYKLNEASIRGEK